MLNKGFVKLVLELIFQLSHNEGASKPSCSAISNNVELMESKANLLIASEKICALEKELESLRETHLKELESLRTYIKELESYQTSHTAELESLNQNHAAELESCKQNHAAELLTLKGDYERTLSINKRKVWVNNFQILFFSLLTYFLLSIYSVPTVVKKGFYIAAYMFRTAAKNAKGFIGKRTNHHAETSEADRKMRINSECKLRHYNQELYC